MSTLDTKTALIVLALLGTVLAALTAVALPEMGACISTL
jgi:hypothetical protein